MSDAEQQLKGTEQQEETESLWSKPELTEAERALKAKVHRHMGMTAAILGVIATGVGFWSIGRSFGISPLGALAEAMPLFIIVLVILGVGILFSLGTSRIAWGIELLVKRIQKRKAG